jgi:hypothetical protein
MEHETAEDSHSFRRRPARLAASVVAGPDIGDAFLGGAWLNLRDREVTPL